MEKEPDEQRAKRRKTDPCDSHGDGTSGLAGGKYLKGVKAFILQAGIVKARMQIFKNNLLRTGGEYMEKYSADQTTHIIVDEQMDLQRMCKIMKLSEPPKAAKIVKSLWLSACIKEKRLVDASSFELNCADYTSFTSKNSSGDNLENSNATTVQITKTDDVTEAKASTSKGENSDSETGKKYPKVGMMWRSYKKSAVNADEGNISNEEDADSDYVPSGEEDADEDFADLGQQNTSDFVTVTTHTKPLPKGHWACAQAPNQQKVNHNKHITDKLEALAKAYENTNDKWRALGYQKAISALKRQPKEITTFEEARSLPGVGERLAEKIWEIIESGDLRKLHEVTESENMKVLELFMGVWGAGATTARTWVQHGFRTLDDLREKANLTRNQRIGLKHYDDLLERMSRSEAAEIEQTVKDAALSINPGLIAMACGSYRRGKATCGDVDVLVTHPDGKSHKGIFAKLLDKLRQSGFITDDLVTQEDNGNQKKYLGVCKLPGNNTKHRRLDIIVVPYDEFACALLFFTGSAHLNRSMRHLAGKMGMSLSEHSLNVGVVRRRGEKLNKGTPLPTPTEESVFQHLGIPYKTPEQRDI